MTNEQIKAVLEASEQIKKLQASVSTITKQLQSVSSCRAITIYSRGCRDSVIGCDSPRKETGRTAKTD